MIADPIEMLHRLGREYWGVVLCASSPHGRELFQQAKNPGVGDWVMETSTSYTTGMKQHRGKTLDCSDTIGILLRKYSDGGLIHTIDGRRFNWTNASFIRLPIPVGDVNESGGG